MFEKLRDLENKSLNPLLLANKGKNEPLRLENVDENSTILYVSGVIDSHDYYEMGAIVGDNFVSMLNGITSPNIEINLTSPGGSVFAGVQMHDAIKAHPSKITVNVVGIVASAATYLVLAADRTTISPMSQIMIHKASTYCGGNDEAMLECAAYLKKIDSMLASQYAEKMGVEPEIALQMMKKETYFTAEEAITAKLIDEKTTFNNKKLANSLGNCDNRENGTSDVELCALKQLLTIKNKRIVKDPT